MTLFTRAIQSAKKTLRCGNSNNNQTQPPPNSTRIRHFGYQVKDRIRRAMAGDCKHNPRESKDNLSVWLRQFEGLYEFGVLSPPPLDSRASGVNVTKGDVPTLGPIPEEDEPEVQVKNGRGWSPAPAVVEKSILGDLITAIDLYCCTDEPVSSVEDTKVENPILTELFATLDVYYAEKATSPGLRRSVKCWELFDMLPAVSRVDDNAAAEVWRGDSVRSTHAQVEKVIVPKPKGPRAMIGLGFQTMPARPRQNGPKPMPW